MQIITAANFTVRAAEIARHFEMHDLPDTTDVITHEFIHTEVSAGGPSFAEAITGRAGLIRRVQAEVALARLRHHCKGLPDPSVIRNQCASRYDDPRLDEEIFDL